jgi:hypothetical protein
VTTHSPSEDAVRLAAKSVFSGCVTDSSFKIHEDVARVINHAGCSMTVGTRDARLEPHFTRALGAVVHDDRVQVTLFVPRVLAVTLLADVTDNGRIAFQAVEPGIFHAFQIKGRYVSHRDSRPDEEALQLAYRDRTAAAARAAGIPDGFWHVAVYAPSVAITFRAEEAFNQTPGPGAGAPMTKA